MNFLKNFYPKKHEAESFLSVAKDKQNKVKIKNTKKIIQELQKNMNQAVNCGSTKIYYFEKDYEAEYGDLFIKEEILNWLERWNQFEGFKLEKNELANYYILSWAFK